MFFFFTYKVLGITSCDYNECSSEEYEAKRKEAINKFNDILKKSEANVSSNMNENDIIILWNNLPKYNFPTGSDDELYEEFCKAVKANLVQNVIIDSPLSLMEGKDITKYVSRMELLYRQTEKKPIFLSGSPYPDTHEDLTITVSNNDTPTEVFSERMDMYVYNSLMEHFRCILNLRKQNETDNSIDFIQLYFEWQRGKLALKECCQLMGNIAKTTFYRYVDEFESSPMYPEYLKIFADGIRDCPKRSNLPDAIDFIVDYCQYRNQGFAESLAEEMLYMDYKNREGCRMYSLIDAHRVLLACMKKIRLLKRKGVLKDTLEERNLTEKDIAIP